MASTVLESAVFRNMFGTEEMRQVFSDEALVQHYLDVEAALARAEAAIGVIPKAAAAAIDEARRTVKIDLDRLRREAENVGYPILGLVHQLAEASGEAGGYVHWGATTQDIMDTASVLQIKQALPVTFGYKAAIWASMMDRHLARIAAVRPRVLVGCFSGAAGTLASLGKDGLKVQAAFCRELGLLQPDITWHVARDGIAEAITALGLLTGSLAKIATDIMLMMTTEFGEVAEPFVEGRGASSTMPQKRNPISCEL